MPNIQGSIPGAGRTPEEDVATHSRILAWRIPWTEEPGGLYSSWVHRVGHDLPTKQQCIGKSCLVYKNRLAFRFLSILCSTQSWLRLCNFFFFFPPHQLPPSYDWNAGRIRHRPQADKSQL